MEILLATLSITGLYAVAVYAHRLWSGHWTIHHFGDFNRFSLYEKILGWAAVLTGYGCVGAGTYVSLAWIPENIGFINADSEYQDLRVTITSLYTTFVFLFLLDAITRMAEKQSDALYYPIIAKGMKEIQKNAFEKYELLKLKKLWSEKVDKIRSKLKFDSNNNPLSSTYYEMIAYEQLCELVETEIKIYLALKNEINEIAIGYDMNKDQKDSFTNYLDILIRRRRDLIIR